MLKPEKLEQWENVAYVLDQVVSNIERSSLQYAFTKTHFDSVHAPSISLYDYMSRIHIYTECSDSCFIIAFIYIDRILQNNPSLELNRKNVHRLILTAAIIAIKYSDDTYASNEFYAKVGGINLAELNLMESDMLVLLNFELSIDPQLYFQYVFNIELESQRKYEAEPTINQSLTPSPETHLKPISASESIGSIKTVC